MAKNTTHMGCQSSADNPGTTIQTKKYVNVATKGILNFVNFRENIARTKEVMISGIRNTTHPLYHMPISEPRRMYVTNAISINPDKTIPLILPMQSLSFGDMHASKWCFLQSSFFESVI